MDYVDLRYLAATADSGNFTRAAKQLGLNPSTVSRRVGRLENELGLPVFERNQKGLRQTAAGRTVLRQVRRALGEFEAIKVESARNGGGMAGDIRLGLRMPPVGEPIHSLLKSWREGYPEIGLHISELSDRDLTRELEARHLDVAVIPSFTSVPEAVALSMYSERLIAALPAGHPLAARETLDWPSLAKEIILVQGWEESQAQREFYARFLGGGARFRAHAASKQSVFALVAAGYGITLAVDSQSEATFPDVVFKPINEPDASLRVDLIWLPELEEPAVGRFVAFMRDECRLRGLI